VDLGVVKETLPVLYLTHNKAVNLHLFLNLQLELREYDSSSKAQEEEEEKKEQLASQNPEESEMRGVHARNPLAPNTVCMAIPRRCLITVEMGQETAVGQAILRSDLDLDAPKHIFLMVYLLWDRKINGANSFFHPYYEILPPTLRNMPIFWSQEELDLLEGSYLLQQIEDRNEAIAEDFHAICQISPLAKICNLQEFKWARMCVCSRNFGLQIDGHRTSALVPHADMLNHYRPRETKWTFDEERQSFTITT
jgi:histone-lysine N-methyltransferase SETD3